LRLLLDTHALLALLSSDFPLSADAEAAIERPGATLLVSVVNVWEIAIKQSIGKLTAPGDLLERVEEMGAELLPITARHAQATRHLPLHHPDPFDRLLIAQAKLEGCALVSADRAFASYDVQVVW
jgi:PIN domain nuclease of toxin-antitoxin system